MEIRTFSIMYSKRKAQSHINKEQELENKLNNLLRENDENNDPNKQILIHELKEQLDEIQNYKTKGAIVRLEAGANGMKKGKKILLQLREAKLSRKNHYFTSTRRWFYNHRPKGDH